MEMLCKSRIRTHRSRIKRILKPPLLLNPNHLMKTIPKSRVFKIKSNLRKAKEEREQNLVGVIEARTVMLKNATEVKEVVLIGKATIKIMEQVGEIRRNLKSEKLLMIITVGIIMMIALRECLKIALKNLILALSRNQKLKIFCLQKTTP